MSALGEDVDAVREGNLWPGAVYNCLAHGRAGRACGPQCVRDGVCADPPPCRGTSQGNCGFCAKGPVCVGEIVGKIGEVGERELVPVVSVRCGKERDMTRG